MPAPNADDPLRTTDPEPSPAPASPAIPADLGQGAATTEGSTAAYVPRRETKSPGTEPEGATGSVAVPGYEIEGVLGRGGMGIVYKARHLALNRTVALKMVLAGGHAGPGELARFRIEAETVARLQHPNIVQIHEVGEAGGHPFCALEFVEGGNLASRIAGQPLPAREAARLVELLARAMLLAHSRNVVHRDLKPANILLAADGTPKITDFGLARRMDSDSGETQAGAIMGTPSYMAPEQASGHAHEAGPVTDVYALGAILYNCLTGRPPFKGETIVETLDQVRTQEPVPPSRWQASVPLDVETICLKCLQKEPEKRYASAGELADDLVRYQRGESILARPVGNLERAWKWVKRNPGWAAAGTAAVLVIVGGVVAGFQFQHALAEQRVRAEEQRQSDLASKNAELEREKDNLEEALAQTCLSPLSEASGPLNDAEMAALGKVATARGKPVARRFVILALHDSQGTRKLGARFQYALHAVVGLDDRERKQFEQLLEDKLRQLDPSDPSGTNLALAASQLGALSPNAAAGVAQALLPALNKTNDPAALVSVAQGLASVADRLEPKGAAAAAAKLAQAMTRTNDPNVLQILVRSLSSVAARLEARDAAEVAAALAQALAQTSNTLSGGSLAQGLSSVASRLEPRDAASTLVDAMKRPNLHPYSLKFLAQGLFPIAARLGPRDAAAVAAAVTGNMIRTADVGASQSLQQCLSAVAARLDPQDAARAAGALLQGLNRPIGFVDPAYLVQGLASLANRLDPREAAKIALAVTQALIKTTNPAVPPTLVGVLKAVATRLEPQDAAEAAAALSDALNQTNEAASLIALVEGLSTVANRLEAKDAAAAAARLVQTMSTTKDFGALNNLARGLARVAGGLQPSQAAGAAAVLTDAMKKADDTMALGPLAEALSLVAARLNPEQSVRVCAEACVALTQAVDGTDNPHVLGFLARGLSAVSAFQEPQEASRASAQVAAKLVQLLGKTANPTAMHSLAGGLSEVASRLQPTQAADAVATIAEALTRTSDIAALKALAQTLSALATRLEPRQAASAIALLTQAGARTNDRTALQHLAEGLSAVAVRAEPREAAATLTTAMNRMTDPLALKTLAEGLESVAARLEPPQAARVCAEAASTLIQAMTLTTDPLALGILGQGLSLVSARLEPGEAVSTASSLTKAMSRTNHPQALWLLAEALSVVAARLEPREVATAADTLIRALARTTSSDPLQGHLTQGLAAVLGDGQRLEQAQVVAATVGSLTDSHGLPGALTLLQPALKPWPRRLSDQQLVDLLKQALCVGPARQAILDHLEYHHRRRFTDPWDFVRYAEETRLGLDFTSPPRK